MAENKTKGKKKSKFNETAMDNQIENQSIIEKFRDYLVGDGKAATTIKSYVRDVTGYLKYIGADVVVTEAIIEQEVLVAYRNSLINSSCRAATINTKLNSLLSFNRCLIEIGLMKKLIVDTTAYRITNDKLREEREKVHIHH